MDYALGKNMIEFVVILSLINQIYTCRLSNVGRFMYYTYSIRLHVCCVRIMYADVPLPHICNVKYLFQMIEFVELNQLCLKSYLYYSSILNQLKKYELQGNLWYSHLKTNVDGRFFYLEAQVKTPAKLPPQKGENFPLSI